MEARITVKLRSDVLRTVGDRARELDKLKEHPSWETLRNEFELLRQAYTTKLARQLLKGGLKAEALNQRELDYQRGFLAGAEWILELPEFAVNALEAALRRMERE